jgi:hypothetical protein
MTLVEIIHQPGWDAGYYTGTIITGFLVLMGLLLTRGKK